MTTIEPQSPNLTGPDYHAHEEYQNRVRKLEELQQLGIDPYPAHFRPNTEAAEVEATYGKDPVGDSEAAAAGTTPHKVIAGRMVLFRAMGKNAFCQLQDGSGRLQVMLNRDLTELEGYTRDEGQPAPLKILEKKLDLGDMVGVEGHLFRTGKGELTLYAKHVTILGKALLPLADKHAGLADKELRYRKRWLDLISNPDIRARFTMRSRILRLIRKFFDDQQFLEVETPVLQPLYGGAEARPFVTELNALDQTMYMRISLELPLKKLLVGGIERLYEMGRVFRNEGIDRTHNPEFTMLEAYAAHWDYNDMMVAVETLYETIANELFGTTKVQITREGEEIEVDVAAPWKRMTMKESIKHYGAIDLNNLDDEELRKVLIEHGADPAVVAKRSRGLLIADLFEEVVEDKLIQPHHIIDHPIETTPLCKRHRDPEARREGIVERFESFILGQEICNSYTELNDPVEQRELLEKQQALRDAGDEEASPLDEEFIEAICQGMPPAAGLGIGIDRLVMFFTNSASIRDVLFFPWMKPE